MGHLGAGFPGLRENYSPPLNWDVAVGLAVSLRRQEKRYPAQAGRALASPARRLGSFGREAAVSLGPQTKTGTWGRAARSACTRESDRLFPRRCSAHPD